MKRHRRARFGEYKTWEEHPTALPREQQEVLDSPDGDPAKRGTIVAAVPILRGGAVPREENHPSNEPHDGIAVATRDTGLVIARSPDDMERLLRVDVGARREAYEALMDRRHG